MKLVRYLRSLDTIPKWLIFVSVTGSTWFFGQESWFFRTWQMDLSPYTAGTSTDWEWVFFCTAIVALVFYWVLFGFKKDSE